MSHRYGKTVRWLGSTLVAGALVVSSGVALADSPERLYQNEVAESADELSVDDLSDEKLRRFLDAAREIREIRREYQERIEEVPSKEREEIQGNAMNEMARVVEESNLDIAEYRQIGHLVENDDDLAQRLDEVATARDDA